MNTLSTRLGELWVDRSVSSVGANPTVFRFTGKELDAETGLYYYGARYLDPKTSRWLSTDPAMYQGDYIPSAPINDDARKRNQNLPNGGIYNYVSFHVFNYSNNNPVKYVDPDGREPIKRQVGTSSQFKEVFDRGGERPVGTYRGEQASEYLRSLGTTSTNWEKWRIEPAQVAFFNNRDARYIYTEQGGWIDMVHFLFYAGKAYDYKLSGKNAGEAFNLAIRDGFRQESTDPRSSAYSYEDLPSDRFGAAFGALYFNPNSNLTLGEQIENYLNDILGATTPDRAPNYNQLPLDYPDVPTRTNRTTVPVYTIDNP